MAQRIMARYSDKQLAHFLLRLTLGINIGLHGVTRLIGGASEFANDTMRTFVGSPLPLPAVHAFLIALPWIEASLGVLLLAGFRLRITLVAGSLLMAILTIGTSLRQDWSVAGLQLIYSFVYAWLLAGCSNDCLSLDSFLRFMGVRYLMRTRRFLNRAQKKGLPFWDQKIWTPGVTFPTSPTPIFSLTDLRG